MIVYVYPADPYGCGEYRLAMPARAAVDAGHQVRLYMPDARTGIGGDIDTRTGRLVKLTVPDDADVVVIQRVAFDALSQAVPAMRRRGIAVVVDMDDDLRRIDPSNPAFWGFRKDWGSDLHSSANVEAACRDATMVTVSSPALLPVYAPHGRGRVLENRVPARYLDLPHEDLAAVGWGGSIHSHPRDLDVLGPSVARAVRGLGIEYWGAGPAYDQAGDAQALRRRLGLTSPGDERYDVDTTGDMPFSAWAPAVATMGVGLAPLADTDFNHAKSWLKPLEYMACGVPWIGSPRTEYVKLHRLTGVGLLADEPRDWYARIKRLVTDGEFRREQSAAGRAAVRERELTYEQSYWRWLEVWEEAIELQRGHARERTVIA
jgi:glycosyltransferase involved in cell wall biosynthesis